jgi:hypothetical protein
MSKKVRRAAVDQVLVVLGIIMTAVFIIVGSLAWYGASFAKEYVRTELAAQKIYFPEKGSPAFSPEDYPDIQQYAGMQVDDGIKAKAYAEGYIGRHLKKVANGKTYSEVSAEFMKDRSNQELAQQRQTLFMGETLRGMLLGSGYAFWTFGQIAEYLALASFAGAAVMAVLVLLGLRRLK